jgi:hypothetical protein
MQPSNHGQTTCDPPTIANILILLRSAVQPTTLDLSLAQPHPKLVLVHGIQPPSNGQCRKTSKNLPRMRFRPRSNTISAIEIRARDYVFDSEIDINKVQKLYQGKGVERRVKKPRILLSPFISRKCPCFPILQVRDICVISVCPILPLTEKEGFTSTHSHRATLPTPLLQLPESIHHSQHLDCANRIREMCIMPRRSPKPATVRLAREHKVYCLISR